MDRVITTAMWLACIPTVLVTVIVLPGRYAPPEPWGVGSSSRSD